MSSRILFPPSERGPSAPVPSNLYENWAGVDMMYHLDGRRHRQSLVYFGEPQDIVIYRGGARPRRARARDHFHLLHCCCVAAAPASTASTSCADARRWRLAQIRPDCSCRLNSSIPLFLALFSRVSKPNCSARSIGEEYSHKALKKARSRGKCRNRLKNP